MSDIKNIYIPRTDVDAVDENFGYNFRYRIVAKDGSYSSDWSLIQTINLPTVNGNETQLPISKVLQPGSSGGTKVLTVTTTGANATGSSVPYGAFEYASATDSATLRWGAISSLKLKYLDIYARYFDGTVFTVGTIKAGSVATSTNGFTATIQVVTSGNTTALANVSVGDLILVNSVGTGTGRLYGGIIPKYIKITAKAVVSTNTEISYEVYSNYGTTTPVAGAMTSPSWVSLRNPSLPSSGNKWKKIARVDAINTQSLLIPIENAAATKYAQLMICASSWNMDYDLNATEQYPPYINTTSATSTDASLPIILAMTKPQLVT